MECNGMRLAVRRGVVNVGWLLDEWHIDLENPDNFIAQLKSEKFPIDIFTFWQRLPDFEPLYPYYWEKDSIAALRVSTYNEWWEKQISAKTRNLVRKAEKKGAEIKIVPFDDRLVSGIVSIFNETPIRQGRPFTHYGKSFEKIKAEMSDRPDQSEFIGAYLDDELIGFIKLVHTDKYTMLTEILSKIAHRDKSPTNALMAKAVEICANKKISLLTYAKWLEGGLGEFKVHNGFERFDLPRYYVPITTKGRIGIRMKIHNGIKGILSDKTKSKLKEIRKKYYEIFVQKN